MGSLQQLLESRIRLIQGCYLVGQSSEAGYGYCDSISWIEIDGWVPSDSDTSGLFQVPLELTLIILEGSSYSPCREDITSCQCLTL